MNRFQKLALPVAALPVLAFVPLPAHAEHRDSGYDGDTRPCATPREVFLPGGGLTRAQVERRWETEGKGERRQTVIGWAWTYPMCDGDKRIALVQFEPGYGTVAYGVATPGLVYKD
jgi:hypothetical protein